MVNVLSNFYFVLLQLKSYEDDFHRENEEKAKFQQMIDKSRQESERAKRENQSHMATIRHLEDEVCVTQDFVTDNLFNLSTRTSIQN